MKTEKVIIVRLYLAQSAERRELLFRRLRHWEKLSGATVVQAVEGFGERGIAQGVNAPTIIEFFETEEAVERVIEDIEPLVDHVVCWPAQSIVKTHKC